MDDLGALDPAWARPLELAWEAMGEGSFPVGAVVLDAEGNPVAEGRNRMAEETCSPRELAGTRLGHAEINALAQLGPGPHSDHVLWTSLEPCLLCTSAIHMFRIGTVRYAAPDPYWAGVERLPELIEAPFARHETTRSGPVQGLARALGAALPAWWHLEHGDPELLQELCVAEAAVVLAQALRARRPARFTDLVAETASLLADR